MVANAQFVPQALAAMELFRGLPPSALAGVAACARVRRMPKDLRIFRQGDDSVRAHAVIEGANHFFENCIEDLQTTVGVYLDKRLGMPKHAPAPQRKDRPKIAAQPPK